jgi:sulfur relay (sulfurtransferase) DsrC/TusE family protein
MSLLFVVLLLFVFAAVFAAGIKFHALFVKEAEAALAEARVLKAEATSLFSRAPQARTGLNVAGIPKPSAVASPIPAEPKE